MRLFMFLVFIIFALCAICNGMPKNKDILKSASKLLSNVPTGDKTVDEKKQTTKERIQKLLSAQTERENLLELKLGLSSTAGQSTIDQKNTSPN
ncbi:hypothetical protein GPALN_005915 [Globodera pallida]|nr:hypothetical protein GPALN_005915 [Globodera pallida]